MKKLVLSLVVVISLIACSNNNVAAKKEVKLNKGGISKEQWDLAKKYQFANTVLYK